MSGAYTQFPNKRIPWSRNGTVSLYRNWSGGSYTGVTPEVGGGPIGTWLTMDAACQIDLDEEYRTSLIYPAFTLNNTISQNYNANNSAHHWSCHIFPEPFDIYGVFFAWGEYQSPGNTNNGWLAWAPDSTNGLNGTWDYMQPVDGTNLSSTGTRVNQPSSTSWITDIWSKSFPGVRAVKFFSGTSSPNAIAGYSSLHLYGEPSNAVNISERILFMDADTGLELDRDLDFGTVFRGSTEQKDVRLKNNSSGMTADAVFLDFVDNHWDLSAALTVGVDPLIDTTYTTGPIAPSGTFDVTVVLAPDTEPDSGGNALYVSRLRASISSWS